MGRLRGAWVSAGAVPVLAGAGCGSGPARVPAVVVLGGAPGGYDAVHAPGSALSGYPALALAYFGEPGLPQCPCSIPLEYFARAVGWLRAQPAGRGRPVVLYGASRSAEAVLLLASYFPHLAAAVIASSPTAAINAAVSAAPGPAWTAGGQPRLRGEYPGHPHPGPAADGRRRPGRRLGLRGSGPHHHGRTARLPGHAPAANPYYPGGGHHYFGFPRTSPPSPVPEVAELGGSPQAGALATEQFWTRMITFLNHLAARQPALS